MPNKNPVAEGISTVLISLMEHYGLSNADLAAATNLAVSSIAKLRLKYSKNPTVETLIPLADYFNIDLDQLLGRRKISGILEAPLQRRTVSFSLPIIALDQICPWLAHKLPLQSNHPQAITGVPVSEDAFAFVATGSVVTSVFNEGAVLIFDKLEEKEVPHDSTYVFVMLPKEIKEDAPYTISQTDLPAIKKIHFDGNNFFLSPINPAFGEVLANPPCTILAALRQIQIAA